MLHTLWIDYWEIGIGPVALGLLPERVGLFWKMMLGSMGAISLIGLGNIWGRSRRNAEELSALFDLNPLPLIIYHIKGTQICKVNEAARKMYGYTTEEFTQLCIPDLHPAKVRSKVVEHLESRDADDMTIRMTEWTHVNRLGETFSVQAKSRAITFEGEPARLVVIIDRTQYHAHTQQIHQLNRQLTEFRFAIERAAIIASLDADGYLTFANENLLDLIGAEQSTVVGRPLHTILAREEGDSKTQHIMGMLNNHQIWRGELPHIHRDGTLRWTQAYVIPFNQQSGRLNNALLIATDITDRKHSEEATLRREAYLQSLVASQSNYLIRLDMNGTFTFVNQRFADDFSISTKDKVLRGGEFSAFLLPEEKASFKDEVARWANMAGAAVLPLELRLTQPGASDVIWTKWEFVRIRDEQGQMVEIQGVGTDITARIQNERHILHQNQKLKEIAWMSSHQLRRPVANMLGLVHLMQEPSPDERHLLDLIAQSVQDLDKIIHEVVKKTYEIEPPPKKEN